jgi:competence protein ComEC
MLHINVVIVSLTYILALLLSSFFGIPSSNFSWSLLKLPILIYFGLALINALFLHRFWRTAPRTFLGLILPFIAILASLWLQLRYPQPSVNDIGKFVEQFQGDLVTITGKVINNPSLNSQNNIRFLVQVNQVKNLIENLSGKLYVTVPILQGTGLSPGQNVTVTGSLYAPQINLNPEGFDFQKYLARQGIYAGLKGVQINEYGGQRWGFWKLRQRIVRAQVRFLSSPIGPVVSSMVLGRRAVDLPRDIQDIFMMAGLAHILAASGFHVALLLGVLLFFIKNFSEQNKLIIGAIILVFYIFLTGGQPSVLRASIMGFGALIGMVTGRKVRRLSFLILTAFILLLINPLWIFELSFQFSFLATFGLIVTLEPIVKRLDFLPLNIANLIAIPVAATVWCLPLSIYVFKSISLYSILINILVTPLVIFISLIGMLSAGLALIFPLLGSLVASVIYYPTAFLITVVEFFVNLPYSYVAIAQISLLQLIIIYSILLITYFNSFLAKKWYLGAIFIISLVTIPFIYNNLTLTQVTILASQNEPIIIIQDRGKFALITNDNPSNDKYIIKPFLAQQGINNLDSNINLNKVKNRKFVLNEQLAITVSEKEVELDIHNQKWLLFERELSDHDLKRIKNIFPDVVLWSGNRNVDQINMIAPKTAIALAPHLNENLKQQLAQTKIELYITGQDGAIQWTPKQGFTTMSQIAENSMDW